MFIASIWMKVFGYFIDLYILPHTKIICALLTVQNILIAITDSFLLKLMDVVYFNKIHRISSNKLLYIFIEEMPNYLFALFFTYTEKIFLKSYKPYFDLASIFYFISALILYNISMKGITRYNAPKTNRSTFFIEDPSTSQIRTLFFSKIFCTITDILIYFFLMSQMRAQSYLVFYYSIEFLFKLINVGIPRRYFNFFVGAKIAVTAFTFICVTFLSVYVHYLFLIVLFLVNGVSNQVIYGEYGKVCGKFDKSNIVIFMVVSCFVMWYGQKPDESFEDFIFFSSVRL